MLIITDNILIDDFIKQYEKKNQRNSYRSALSCYLDWRKISPEELISNGEKELLFLQKYLTDDSLDFKRSTREIRVTITKHFLRFYGTKIPSYIRKKKALFFESDIAMKEFLIQVGNSYSSQKEANRAIYYYCLFRNKESGEKFSPTKLVEESKELSTKDIRVLLLSFYNYLEIKYNSAWALMKYVNRFYTFVCDKVVILPTNKKKSESEPIVYDGVIIEKEIVDNLLKYADLRDSMIILTAFESGINPCDLIKLDYSDLKEYLNLENPTEIKDVAAIQYKRRKTNKYFIACFGKKSLEYMSLWLKGRKEGTVHFSEEIIDETPIFSKKKSPFGRLKAISFIEAIKTVSSAAGYDPALTSGVFRDSFNTRIEHSKLVSNFTKEIFMGHRGGIERHYSKKKLETYQDMYRQVWEMLFDISYDHERIVSVEEENREIKGALAKVVYILENLELAKHRADYGSRLTQKEIGEALTEVKDLIKYREPEKKD